MANQHKITIYVDPKRATINLRIRGVGNILDVNLAGFLLESLDLPHPATVTTNVYLSAILNLALDALAA
jgi:hypothetical protein